MERKKFHVKKNDLVMVIAGRDKGKRQDFIGAFQKKSGHRGKG